MSQTAPRAAVAAAALISSMSAIADDSLYFFSEPGDYIGQGQEVGWTDADGTFTFTRNYDNGITLRFLGAQSWTLGFAAPADAELAPGVYEGAVRLPFQGAGEPGLSVSGNGRGCNTLRGSFQILEVSYDTSGNVTQLAADFEQHCGGSADALFGSIRHNSPLEVTTGRSELSFDSEQGDYIGQGLSQTWTPNDGTLVAQRNYDEGVSARFTGVDPSTWWSLDFAAADALELVRGPYEDAARFPFNAAGEPALSVSGSGRGCNTLTGRYDVLEARYAENGDVERFAADFEQHCEGAEPALFGSVRFNSFEEITDGFTLLHLASEPGDYIGQGQTGTWRRSTGRFSIARNHDAGVSVSYADDDPSAYWRLDFAAPGDAPLDIGLYETAARFPMQSSDQPGLSVTGSGRGCNSLTGQFEVLEAAYADNGDVERFAADFEQHCEDSEPALIGAIRVNSLIPIASETPDTGSESVTPWQDNASGSLVTDIPWSYAMGYRFTPQVAGEITALGGFFDGTKLVRLFDDTTGALLAEAQVTGSNDWSYGDIEPVAVAAGATYSVAVYLAGSGGSYRWGAAPLPQTFGDVRIEATVYGPTYANPTARPTYAWAGTAMYGQADIRFTPVQ